MEKNVEFLENFFKELNRYCEIYEQTEKWYESMKTKLAKDQNERRARNEENYEKQQASFGSMKDKTVKKRNIIKDELREKILKKQEILNNNIVKNSKQRDRILLIRDKIVRPEFFKYSYKYKDYGDFYPQVTKLEDYSELNLQDMVDKINSERSGLIMNRIRGLFRSEDMMVEYASFANLIGKARSLCEIENDALRDAANTDIKQLESQLIDEDNKLMNEIDEISRKKKKIESDNEGFKVMFEQACLLEERNLKEDYKNRQLTNYDNFKEQLNQNYPVDEMRKVYDSFEKAQKEQHKFICSDGVPLQAKLGQLWFGGTDTLKNNYVKQLLEREYSFMIQEGRLSIPGIA